MSILFSAAIALWKTGNTHFSQNTEHGAKLGEARLKQVKPHKTGEPEPIGRMEVGKQQRNNYERAGHNAYNTLNVIFFFHGVSPLVTRFAIRLTMI